MAATSVLRTLRQLRLERGHSLRALAELSGVDKPTLSQIERGRLVANPQELAAIGKAIGAEGLENRVVPCIEETTG